MWSVFERNVYRPYEDVRAMVNVDNHECDLAVKRVMLKI